MNGGAYGGETKDVLVEARGVDRAGQRSHASRNADMGYTYRHCGAPEDVIFTEALFQGAPGDRAAIAAEMDEITEQARGDASRSRARPAARPSRTRPAARPGN